MAKLLANADFQFHSFVCTCDQSICSSLLREHRLPGSMAALDELTNLSTRRRQVHERVAPWLWTRTWRVVDPKSRISLVSGHR
jgi:hypothetical protein